MTATAIVSAALALEALILFRCLRTGIVRSYPMFFAYLSCVFLGDLVLPPLSRILAPHSYAVSYWTKEFVCVIAGYAVVMEIVERAFAHFEGPKRLGRNAALLIFAAIVGLTALRAAFEAAPTTVSAWIDIEANLRAAELVILSIVIAVIFYYSIPIGKNLKGIIVGYGFCTVAVAVNEAIRSFAGHPFEDAFTHIWSYSYLVSLVVWVAALWSYQPNPAAGLGQIDGDYQALANRTRATLADMRGYLRKAVRS